MHYYENNSLKEQELNNKKDVLEAIDKKNKELEEINKAFKEKTGVWEFVKFETKNAEDLAKKNNDIETLYGSEEELEEEVQELENRRLQCEQILAKLKKALVDYKNFNKRQFFDNVRYLLKDNTSVKIGQIEKEAGVSAGYMSRMEKEGNTSDPSIELVYTASKLLGVSLDILLNVDLVALKPTEKYMVDFIQKLEVDTISDRLNWNIESADYLNQIEGDINGKPNHPLFSLETFYEESEIEYPNQVTDIRFVSHSFNCNTYINGDCFNLGMKDGSRLYLMDVSKSVHASNDMSAYAKEMWMYKPDMGGQYLIGTKDTPGLACVIESLFNTVKISARHPKVSIEAKSIIDAYMEDDWGQNDSSELPFA